MMILQIIMSLIMYSLETRNFIKSTSDLTLILPLNEK